MVALSIILSILVSFNSDSKTIFGTDDRIPIREIKNDSILEQSKSIVLIADRTDFYRKNKNYYFKNTVKREKIDYSRFSDELTMGHCTGTLTSANTILTAAHCVAMISDPLDCKNLVFLFDYTQIKTEFFTPAQFRQCKRVLKADRALQHDYAILELSKPVLDRTPIPYVRSTAPFGSIKNLAIYMIGHPSGRTMKYTGNAKIFGVSSFQDQWRTNLDAFHGNSGGPVFSAGSNQMIGILTSGTGADFRYEGDKIFDAEAETDPPRKSAGTFVTPLELILQTI